MRKKILNHTCVLIVISVLLTFLAAGMVMYSKYNEDLKDSVRDSTKYIQDSIEKMGNAYLDTAIGKATSARITLLDPNGDVLFDSLEDPSELANHSGCSSYWKDNRQCIFYYAVEFCFAWRLTSFNHGSSLCSGASSDKGTD